MFTGEHFSGTSKSCHDLIGNKMDIILSCQIPCPFKVVRVIHMHAACSLNKRLDNKCRNSLPISFKHLFKCHKRLFGSLFALVFGNRYLHIRYQKRFVCFLVKADITY